MLKGVLQNVITARHSEPARTLAWESVLYPRGNGLPQPLRGFAMTREGHFATRPAVYRIYTLSSVRRIRSSWASL